MRNAKAAKDANSEPSPYPLPRGEGDNLFSPREKKEMRGGSIRFRTFRLSIFLKATLSVSRMGRSFRISHIDINSFSLEGR